MEVQIRRNEIIQDQENMHVVKKIGVPVKRLNVRGALGEINSNTVLQSQNVPKCVQKCEIEKKTADRRIKSSYKHVQSKVNTGLAVKVIQPASRPPLRREESTGRLAARAVVAQTATKDKKKPVAIKENTKENKPLLKQTIKEPIESLSKLKLGEKEDKINKQIVCEQTAPTLPDDIEDIDARDSNTVFQITAYIKDIYKYMTELELKYPIVENHMANQVNVTGRMRATLIDWLVEVQNQFSLELETFHLTVSIIDRYLQAVSNVPRNRLQLVGVTAMFIASKYEEVYPPAIGDFIFITDKAYSVSDVIKCEEEIMRELGFSLARPIPLSFLRRYIKAAHGSPKNHHLAKYFVDLCLVDYSMAHYRPSELAAAAVCLSLYILSKKTLTEAWTLTLSYYSGYTLEHIEPIIRKIAKIVTNVENSKFQAVYNKYLDATLAKVSSLPQLKDKAILELAK